MSLDRLKELIHELNCIQYGRFELASGGVSSYKIACDPLFRNSEARGIIGELGCQIFKDIETEKAYDIVGVVTGGYDFAKLVADRLGREVVSVNPHNREIVKRPAKSYYCYFEDVVTKGGSILKCRQILGKSDGKDNCALTLITREEGGKENLSKNGIELKHILTKGDLGVD